MPEIQVHRVTLIPLVMGMLLILPATGRGADSMGIQPTVGNPGADGVAVPVTATNDEPFQAFSLALTYPTTPLDCVGVSFVGTVVETILGGLDPEYVQPLVDDEAGEVLLGVIFDLDPVGVVEIPPTPALPGNEIVRLLFDVGQGAAPGDYLVDLVDGLGTPPVDNVLSTSGTSIHPALQGGLFTIPNLYTFRARDTRTAPGSVVDVFIECTNETPVEAFTVSLVYSKGVLTPVDVATFPDDHFQCTDLQELLHPEGIEYVDVFTDPFAAPGLGWIAMAVVFDFLPPLNDQALPMGQDQTLVRFPFQVTSNPTVVGTTTTIDLTNDFPLGAPVSNLVVIPPDFDGITPTLVDGTIEIVDETTFRRGDANADGANNLADAIFVLTYLFAQPAPAPSCFDAADFNDDGAFDITDAIYFINYLFTQGCPPPGPFPGCGVDADDSDALGCASYPGC